jgi:hypothetical protein
MKKRPSYRHWRFLLDEGKSDFGLRDFLQHWEVTPTEIARICCCSRRSVYRWLNGADLPDSYRFRLIYVHQLWLRVR